ncbi:hypothetical protein BDZ94DRAFT_1276559 [Collybia nuda]|uniref:BTB domain-containing protein n=1 Tax=Collybia nuda TaxID=64659 RepID=A0A9P6CCJ8_9AGAR|nr:hypothetical protein BDZ94DRAFT_1276559 [Collybia nuda]
MTSSPEVLTTLLAQLIPEDLVFSTQDSVCFYVHSAIFSGAAENAFRCVLSRPISDPTYQTTIIHVPEVSEVLNIMFHALYNISCLKNSPSFDSTMTTIYRMPVYGINPKDYLIPSTSLHELLLHHIPHHPLEIYTIAAHYDAHDIAEATSAHLLAYPLSSITDEMAIHMGPVYLKRLLCLHANRSNTLKYTVMLPPAFHEATESCTFADQGRLSRAWVLVAAYLVWDSQPSLSVYSLEAAFRPLQGLLTCSECRELLADRVKEAAQEWSGVKCTI